MSSNGMDTPQRTALRNALSGWRRQGVRIGIILALTLFAQGLQAQTDIGDTTVPMPIVPDFYVGGFVGYALVSYDVSVLGSSFDARSAAPATSPFNNGDGSGFQGGILFELPFSESFRLGARIGFQSHTGTLSNTYVSGTEVRSLDGSPQIGTILGTVEADITHLGLTPYAWFTPFSFPLYVIVGPTVLLPGSVDYTYTEEVSETDDVVFLSNGVAVRRLATRSATNASTAIAVTAAIGYDIDLAENFSLFLELQSQTMISDYLTFRGANEVWRGTTLSPTIGFRIGIGGAPAALPPPPVIARDTGTYTPTQTADSSFRAKGVTSDGLSDTLTIASRQVKATEVHALLPYIFFDRDSAEIPARYVRYDTRSRRSFQLERLPRGNTLSVYYELLNIVGQRMRENRRLNIVLHGYTSIAETDSTLGVRRMMAVKQYLTDVWRIADRRIEVDSAHTGLPPNPSLSDVNEAEAARENQRVEIYSVNNVAEAPVRLPDTAFLAPVGIVRFLPPASEPDSLQETTWSLDVKIGDSLIKDAVTGVGTPPAEIDYELRPGIDIRAGTVSSTLVIQDTAYNELVRIPSQEVVLQQEGNFVEERTTVGDNYVDVYTILLYSFDSSQVAGYAWQAAQLIRDRMTPDSRLRIIGHTDRIGMPYYNRNLSKKRAEFAAQLLGMPASETSGMGEKELLYDNDFPEGRYYSRTVTVIVETPIDSTKPPLAPTDATPQREEDGAVIAPIDSEGTRDAEQPTESQP